jgi:hypothetical protein
MGSLLHALQNRGKIEKSYDVLENFISMSSTTGARNRQCLTVSFHPLMIATIK